MTSRASAARTLGVGVPITHAGSRELLVVQRIQDTRVGQQLVIEVPHKVSLARHNYHTGIALVFLSGLRHVREEQQCEQDGRKVVDLEAVRERIRTNTTK